ncbi:MAG: helix-turn-helix domain-containing protein [Oscillospiraceae bacterium]
MTVGEKIKAERKALGLTQTELGEKLGVQKNAVSKWECGRVDDIPGSKIKAMAALFGVTPSYLIDDGAELPAQPDFDDFTYAMYNETKDLPEEKKQMLLDMARFMKADLEKEKQP